MNLYSAKMLRGNNIFLFRGQGDDRSVAVLQTGKPPDFSNESFEGLSVGPCARQVSGGCAGDHVSDGVLPEQGGRELSDAFTLHQIPAVGLNPLCKACVYSGFPRRRRRPLKGVRRQAGRRGGGGGGGEQQQGGWTVSEAIN